MPTSDPNPSPDTDQRTDDSGMTEDARQRLKHQYRELEQTYGDTRARIEDINEQAVNFIRENPAVTIFGALATGYLIGRLASRRWLV